METRLVDPARSSDRLHVLARPFHALLTPAHRSGFAEKAIHNQVLETGIFGVLFTRSRAV
jgi:hypothetical protein